MRKAGLRNVIALSTLALVSGLTIGPAAAAPASPMAPLDCTHPHSNKDGGSGYGEDPDGSIHVRTGPHEYCAVVEVVSNNRLLYWHCWTENSAGNRWTHLRVAGTQINGWVVDSKLTGGGSNGANDRC
ncbi:SH3 domain-containing protein [Streptomyces sp. NPDC055078]